MSSPLDDLRRALSNTDYEVERELGHGGMAVVYLATHRGNGRRVAIKVLHADLAGSVGHDRFLREIRIASELVHPGILTVEDSGEADGLLYYVMPYVEGESLRDRLRREAQLPIEDARAIARQVAEALHHAHERGFVHRDIKPENILLDGDRTLVADFGIARAVDQAGADKLTQTGLAVGTPAYMSPEQGTGDRVDGRADQYALGCVLFEMLVGEPPFTGPTLQVIVARHLMQEVPSMRVARSTIPEELETAVRQAMAKAPADRFPSAAAFAEALRARPAGHDGSRPAFATGGTPIARITGTGTGGGAAATTTGAIATPAPAGSRARRVVMAAAAFVLLAVAGFLGYRQLAGGDDLSRSRLVVLPFRNVGAPEDEYFSDGITEEITARLSSVARLGVIARTSAMQYRNSSKSVKEIGVELGVGHLVEGSVRWDRTATGRPAVRITTRLIRVSDGTQVWATDMSFELSQVFVVQATVAEKVVEALNLVLLAPERAALTARPTASMTAYDFYLRGNAYYNRSWERADVDSALVMYQRATEQDPQYALAWAQLGKTHAWMHRLGYDETPERLALARAAIQKAFALNDNLPEAHIAQGLYHYWGEWNFEKAIDELTAARALQPSNAWVHLQIGNVRRRQGEWQAAVESYERAGEFDPRFHIIWFNIGHLHLLRRQYDQAEPYIDRALLLQPTFLDAYILKTDLQISARGDVAAARQWFDSTRKVVPPERWRLLAGHWLLGPMRTMFPDAATRLGMIAPGRFGLDSSLALLARGEALQDLGAKEAARATNDSAVAALEAAAARSPTVAWMQGALAVAYAHQGRSELALTAAKRAQRLMPDAFDGPAWIMNEARVQLLLGNRRSAIDALELLVKMPSGMSTQWLRVDPAWTPLRSETRFRQLTDARPPARRAS